MINELARNLLYYIEIAFAKPLYAVLPGLIAVLVGAYFILMTPRTYHSEALLIMEFQQIPTTLVSPTVSNDRLQFIEQRVLSRNNLLALGERHHLFGDVAQAWSKTQLAGTIRHQVTLDIQFTEGADRTARNASVRIGFKYDDPIIATDVVSDLVSQIIEENKRIRVARAAETTKFLTHEVDSLEQRFREREAVWARYLTENNDSHPSRIPALLIEMQAKEQEFATLDRAVVTVNEEIRLLEAQLRMGAGETSEAARLQSQLAELETDIAAKSVIYSQSHPQIRAMKQRIEEVKARVGQTAQAGSPEALTTEEINALPPALMLVAERIAGIKPRQEQTLAQRADLAERLGRLRTTISRAPEVESQIAAFEAEKISLQRTLDDMQSKLNTARLGERLEEGEAAQQIDVVEAPEIPNGASGPRRLHLAMAVLAAASAASAAGIYAAHLFDRTIRGTFDLANALAGETLVVIPRWNPRRHIAKAFRNAGDAGVSPTPGGRY
jgi:uncharacterized protein involved in exopolysaccharide biosynthesis